MKCDKKDCMTQNPTMVSPMMMQPMCPPCYMTGMCPYMQGQGQGQMQMPMQTMPYMGGSMMPYMGGQGMYQMPQYGMPYSGMMPRSYDLDEIDE